MTDAQIILGMPFEEYLAVEAVNFSTLKHIDVSPLHYRDALDNGVADKPDFALGRAAHTAILEPEKWGERYMLKPEYAERDGKRVQLRRDDRMPEWRALVEKAEAEGRTILTDEEWITASRVANRVHSDPVASLRFKGDVDTEVTVLWTHPGTGLRIKSRLDVVNRSMRVLCDPKTVAFIDPPRMWSHFERLLYLAQFAMYQDAWRVATGDVWPFEAIAIEKTRPYDVAVCPVPQPHLDYGRSLYETWLDELARCLESQQWPGVARGEVLPFERPGSAQFGDDAEILAESETA